MRPWFLLCLLYVGLGLPVVQSGDDPTHKQIKVEKSVTFSKSRSSSTSTRSSSSVRANVSTKDEDLRGSDTQTLLRHVDPFLYYPSQVPLPFTNSFGVTPPPPARPQEGGGSSSKTQVRSRGQRVFNGGPLSPAVSRTRGKWRMFSRPQSGKRVMGKNISKFAISGNGGKTGEEGQIKSDRIEPSDEVAVLNTTKHSGIPKGKSIDSKEDKSASKKPLERSIIIAQLRKLIFDRNTKPNQLRPTPVVTVHGVNIARESGPLISPVSKPTSKPLTYEVATNIEDPLPKTLFPDSADNFTTPSNDMKMVLMVKADLAVASTTTPSPSVVKAETLSPSMPLVVISTPAPLVRVTKKKHVAKQVYQPHKYFDFYHEPLYSMYGPPYDHYKMPSHPSHGGSFPSAYPRDHSYYPQRYFPSRFPHLSSYSGLDYHQPQYYPDYHLQGKQKSHLAPYFSDDPPPSTAPARSYTVSPPQAYSPTPPPTYTPYKTPPSYTYVPTKSPKHLPKHKELQRKTAKSLHKESKAFVPPDVPIVTTPAPVTKTIPPLPKPQRKRVEQKRVSSGNGNVSGGQPGVDYPAYDGIPYTSFTCRHARPAGIYADVEAGCQVWHICEADGRLHSFLCPNGTIFSQHLLTCDWWYNVQCSETEKYYGKSPSMEVYKKGHNDIDTEEKPVKKHKHALQAKPVLSSKHLAPYEYPIKTVSNAHGSTIRPPAVKPLTLPPKSSHPSHFVEFEPYAYNTYPMYQLNKRHRRGNK